MNVKAIRIYKMNTTAEEREQSFRFVFDGDYDEEELAEMEYNPTDGGGMCYGDATSMLVRLADDYYLTIYEIEEIEFSCWGNRDEFEIEDAFRWMGLEFREPTLIFNQECMC